MTRNGPAMAAVELVPLFRRMLDLSLVIPTERVLIFSDAETRPEYAAAAIGAARSVGADTAHMVAPPMRGSLDEIPDGAVPFGDRQLVGAWKLADFVFDLTMGFWPGYMDTLAAACPTGTRILCVNEPADMLHAASTGDRSKKRAGTSRDILRGGRHLRITSDAGTDLVVDKGDGEPTIQYGFADEPGRWDRWGRAHAAVSPVAGGTNGVLTLQPGDILIPLARYVTASVRLEVRDGRIVHVGGDSADAALLRWWFEQWDDENALIAAHFGWGLQERADWHRMGNLWLEQGGLNDAKGFDGSVPLAFGHSAGHVLRGSNESPAHIDITCRGCSVSVDDQPILDRGRFTHRDLI